MRSKITKEKILVITTILVISIVFIGIGYAFFTANNPEGSTAQIISENGRMLITYNDGTDNILPVANIQPSNSILVNKTFTLTGSNTTVGLSSSDGLTMPYKVGVQYTSGFSDGMLHYYIKKVDDKSDADVSVNYVITPEENKTEDDYKNQTVPGNDAYTGYVHGTFKKGNNKYIEMVNGNYPASLNDKTITFNLIIQFPDNNENQDSEKGKTFNGKIVINYELPKATTFAEDSWETIAKVVQSGQLDAYTVGSEKEVEISGTSYTVRVANNTTPEECNGEDFSQTACGFVVEFVDIVERRAMNSTSTNVGGWPASAMRIYANGDFYNKLPSDLQKVISDTKVISGHGSTSGETNFTSTDKIYLLSVHEVWEDGTSNQVLQYDTASNNTRQLDYYKSKGVTTNNYSGAMKQYNKSIFDWWLRSSYSSSSNTLHSATNVGSCDNSNARAVIGFAPAFRIG